MTKNSEGLITSKLADLPDDIYELQFLQYVDNKKGHRCFEYLFRNQDKIPFLYVDQEGRFNNLALNTHLPLNIKGRIIKTTNQKGEPQIEVLKSNHRF